MSIDADSLLFMNLDQKINQLLEESKIDYLLSLDTSDRLIKKSLKIRLKRLVQILFELDAYTESKEILEDDALHVFQKNIRKAIKGLYIKPLLLDRYVSNVIKYMKLEGQLREHIHPDSFELNYFYYYKSSRIKLIRAIIYHKLDVLKGSAASDWANLDLLRSITDDLEDIQEDKSQYNANRFLFSLANQGQQETIDSYKRFIQFRLEKNTIQGNELIKRDITKWTEEEARRIIELLDNYQKMNPLSQQTELPVIYQRQSSF